MSFTWTDNIPNPPNVVSFDVPDMQENTQYLSVVMQRDHVICVPNHNDGSTFEGGHKQISLNAQGPIPGPAGVSAFDSLVWSNGGQLYWKNALAVPTGTPLTLNILPGFTIGAHQTLGSTFLPGGLIMNYG